ncbi:hypothetical protein BC835DRAFT_858207 [Cytidiella melzeri]|nr:hypothetical protein BC835DRAFT_858207 [Cytidiella melzeri]
MLFTSKCECEWLYSIMMLCFVTLGRANSDHDMTSSAMISSTWGTKVEPPSTLPRGDSHCSLRYQRDVNDLTTVESQWRRRSNGLRCQC